MICVECQHDDGLGAAPLDGLTEDQIVRFCREWRCSECLRSEDEIQADFDAASAKEKHQSAHDWSAIAQHKDHP